MAARTAPPRRTTKSTRWASLPPTLGHSSHPTYQQHPGLGYAEIKPHNLRGIRKGLQDLARFSRVPSRKGRPRFLITYRYTGPAKPRQPLTIAAYVLTPRDSAVTDTPTLPSAPGPVAEQQWLASLGTWATVPLKARPELALDYWATAAGAPAFGSLLEHYLRDAFITKFSSPVPVRAHLTARKEPHDAGPDVRWYELAEFLQELSRELRHHPHDPRQHR